MTWRCFEVERVGKVAHVRLSRPDELNTMVREFWNELPRIVRELDASGDVRAIVLSSTGRHFCAGMDLGVFTSGDTAISPSDAAEMGRVRARLRQTALMLQESFTAFERARMPVLAAIQGGCIGGGVDMVTAADLRYATEDAFFCIQEINIGMTADVGTLQRLPKLIPPGIAAELAYTGRRWAAEEAWSAGFVNAVYPDQDTMLAAVRETALEIASKSPMAIWGTKQTMHYAREHSTADGLEYIATWNAGMFDPADMAEAFTAKAEKRPADFPDLLPVSDGI